MSTSSRKVRGTKRKLNVVRLVLDSQTSGRGITNTRMLPDEIIADGESRIGVKTHGYEGIPESLRLLDNFSGRGVGDIVPPTKLPKRLHTVPNILKDICIMLSHDGYQEFLSGSGRQREIKKINSEVFIHFGGLELVIQILLRPTLYIVNVKSQTLKDYTKSVACGCLDVLHQICLNTNLAIPLAEMDDLMPYLFTLMGEKKCFLSAATLMEDLLGARKQMLRLDEIENLKDLVDGFDQQQLANFCRVLSIAVSDLDSCSEERLMFLVAQDEASRKQTAVPISEINQGILVDLPGFIKRLVEVAGRKFPPPSQNMPAIFSELESWVTWLDSSLAFDALMEVAQEEEEVYLTIPLDEGQGGGTSLLPGSMRIMHEIMYKVEVLYVLCLLLSGKQRNKVQDMLAKCRLIPSLNDVFDKIIWKCNLQSRSIPNGNCECSPEIALKIQFLRLVHSFSDHHPNKYLLLSRSEVNELNRISAGAKLPVTDAVKDINRQYLCSGQKGLLTKVVEAMKKETVESPFRFWLGRAIESVLRGVTSYVDQLFLLRRGLLEHIVSHMVHNEIKSKEILQSSFDLLGELIKFNINAFKRFNNIIKTDVEFNNFISQINNNIVDSNMFIRCMVLSLEHFETEQIEHKEYATTKCKLLGFICERKRRLQFLFKLIQVIKVQSITQENVSCLNTTLVFLMFAKKKGELQAYLSAFHDEEHRQCNPGLIMANFRHLLVFWQDHYLHKDKDCSALEKSSCINFDEWKKSVADLLEDDPSNDLTVSYYLAKNCIDYK